MHETRNSNFITKTNTAIVTAVKDASCNSGWVRFIVQGIFGVITFVSFILILIMAMQRSYTPVKLISPDSRCVFAICKVTCMGAPSHGLFEDDIIDTVTTANTLCANVELILYNAEFINQTMPGQWLASTNTEVKKLTIVGGNLNHIETGAFLSSFLNQIESLQLADVKLYQWQPDTLVGLQNLKKLMIKSCRLNFIHRNALRPVDETLESLIIRDSGHWQPKDVTGSSYFIKLTNINFSQNRFGILNSNSFTRIDRCKYLDLSSSAISGIRPHTFDYIFEIEVINLSNNHIMTLPENLLSRVLLMGGTPRIDLHRNMWHCSCNLLHLVDLSRKGVLIPEPLCHSPLSMFQKPISAMQRHCSAAENMTYINNSKNIFEAEHGFVVEVEMFDLNNNYLCKKNSTTITKVVSPVRKYSCPSTTTLKLSQYKLLSLSREAPSFSLHLKPSFYMKNSNMTMLEFTSETDYRSGLIWFQTKCPSVIYCIDILPRNIKIYNVELNSKYTLCPIPVSGSIESGSCITYKTDYVVVVDKTFESTRFFVYGIAIILGVFFGASVLYGIIRRNPTLLKGSKRVLLVKHKVADAIILPSKVSLSNNEVGYTNFGYKREEQFVNQSQNMATLKPEVFKKSFSIRSSKSNAPSYISALQPTEEQLKEWRLKHHFDNNSTLTSISSAEYHVSCIYNGDILNYSQSESIGSADSGTSRIFNLQ